jgi:hypothetical protein
MNSNAFRIRLKKQWLGRYIIWYTSNIKLIWDHFKLHTHTIPPTARLKKGEVKHHEWPTVFHFQVPCFCTIVRKLYFARFQSVHDTCNFWITTCNKPNKCVINVKCFQLHFTNHTNSFKQTIQQIPEFHAERKWHFAVKNN